jgi:hypothetical protein
MTWSLWSVAGALVGAVLGYVNFRVIIGILEPRLRALDKSSSAAEQEAFEQRLVWLKRIFLALEILVVGAIGWFAGSLIGG